MNAPVRITLESTEEIGQAPPAVRIWTGKTDEGVLIVGFIALAAIPSGNREADERARLALERRIVSKARIIIPVDAR